MPEYNAGNAIFDSQTDKPAWLLEQAARYEKRLELGHHIDHHAHEWLHKPSQLPRLALWLELLHKADIDGVCDLATLSTWQFFDTARKRAYLLRMLEQHGLVMLLGSTRVQVAA